MFSSPAMPSMILAAALTFMGCTSSIRTGSAAMQKEPSQTLSIKGSLTYRERIALPPNSTAVVELRDTSSADGPVIAERRIELKGKQVPIPFELTVDRAELAASSRYTARGGIISAGRPSWATEPVSIDPTAQAIDLGTLRLLPVKAEAFVTALRCGNQTASIGHTKDSIRLTVGTETFDMRQVVAASGARYEAVSDPSTTFWSRGDRAMLVVKGRTYPECTKIAAETKSFRATGNEPGWRIDITDATITLLADYGQTRIVRPVPAPETSLDSMRYVAKDADGDLTVTIYNRHCTDTMSGMPHPNTVTVVHGGKTLNGCGGDPATLLQGAEWVVEDINGNGIVDRSRMTLRFDINGRVLGLASCNNYTSTYSLTGESLTISKAAATMKACAPALMRQEEVFLSALRDVQRFTLNSDGALTLHTGDQRTVTARRQ